MTVICIAALARTVSQFAGTATCFYMLWFCGFSNRNYSVLPWNPIQNTNAMFDDKIQTEFEDKLITKCFCVFRCRFGFIFGSSRRGKHWSFWNVCRSGSFSFLFWKAHDRRGPRWPFASPKILKPVDSRWRENDLAYFSNEIRLFLLGRFDDVELSVFGAIFSSRFPDWLG